jgi:electron transport complex protein RnfG
MSFKEAIRQAGILAVGIGLAGSAFGKTFLSADEALRAIYPGCEISRDTQYLSPEQMKKASDAAGTQLASAVVIRYLARCAKGGIAYTDTHRVRTHPETLLIALDPEGKVLRIEVLSFDEPPEYMPKVEWYGTFKSQSLTPELELKRAIPTVTGASLTSRATTEAARRVLAIHEALSKKPARE